MEAILGLAMLYATVHAMVIVAQEIKVEGYKKVVLIVGGISIALVFFGVIATGY
jgi:hypothetical protein